jgi:Contractile injection system tube protein
MSMSPSIDAVTKLNIIGIEGDTGGLTVEAQFNPKEISVDKSVPWQRQAKKGPADLEYTGGGSRTMSFELMFDGFETGTSVQPEIGKLQRLSDRDDDLKRPPMVRVVWGSTFPVFKAVIESLAVKYTMFDGSGTVLRATAHLTLKEALHLKVAKPQ